MQLQKLSFRFFGLATLTILVSNIYSIQSDDDITSNGIAENQNLVETDLIPDMVEQQETNPENQASFSHFLNNRNCQCGVKLVDPGKIVGGTLSPDNGWPWMAALIYTGNSKSKQFCGATLINDRYLLTAGHCVREIPFRGFSNFKVFLGGNVIPEDSYSKDLINVLTIRIHPMFNPGTLENDLALIRLEGPVTFSNEVKPICLSQKGAPFAQRNATVTGWGWTLESTKDNLLREVDVQVIPNSECQESYEHLGIKITPSMMCATLPGKDSCKGDSGGPLVLSNSSEDPETLRHNLVGVVSFGQKCASPTYPGVYTRVSKLMSWIKRSTKDAFSCVL